MYNKGINNGEKGTNGKMKAKIVYASMTGHDEDMAEVLEEDLQDEEIQVDSSEISFSDATDYLHCDLCLLVTYTYGEGQMTDELADFYDQLKDLKLPHQSFMVLGSGDKTYGKHFCQNVFDFEQAFKDCGAKEILPPLTVENAPSEADFQAIDQAAKEMNRRLNA